ncbi:ATP-dependent DNA helicase RecG, partial [Bifidobacterium animalis subsp. lactis]
PLETPLHAPLATKRRVSALTKLGGLDERDALTYYPFRVTDPGPVRALVQAQPGLKEKMAGAVRGRSVRVSPMNARAGYRVEVRVDDDEFAATLHVR